MTIIKNTMQWGFFTYRERYVVQHSILWFPNHLKLTENDAGRNVYEIHNTKMTYILLLSVMNPI